MKYTVLALALTAAFPAWADNQGTASNTTINPQNLLVRPQLTAIGADDAWSRGWTGLGSRILIMDSGINLNHRSFTDRVIASINFTRSTLDDRIGHGTHVASIAAGAPGTVVNGQHYISGVAPEAQLLIAKLTDNLNISTTFSIPAMQWAQQYDVDVANLSASSNYDPMYRRTITRLNDGTYYGTDSRYAGKTYNLEDPQKWRDAMGPSMVLVVAAGNNGLPYANSPGALATSVDAAGNLVLDGRMIVVGSWNILSQSIDTWSNKAGTICQRPVEGMCTDKYRVSDFYLMAPGIAFGADSGTENGYKILSGTSMATPAVSGAVAVISQMWPQMPGRDVAQLLFDTADKNIKDYNKEVHGQGLLDLDRATRPVGNLTLQTSGRISTLGQNVYTGRWIGTNYAIKGQLSSRVMVVDSFGRDFYDTGSNVAAINYQPFNFDTSVAAYDTVMPTMQNLYTSFTDRVSIGNNWDTQAAWTPNTKNVSVEVGHNYRFIGGNIRLSTGVAMEEQTAMGMYVGGSLGSTGSTNTVFSGLEISVPLSANTKFGLSGAVAQSHVGMYSQGLMTMPDNMVSASFSANISQQINKSWTVGTVFKSPMQVIKGTAQVTTPVGLDGDFNIVTQTQNLDLRPLNRQYDLGIYAKYNYSNHSATMFVENRLNYQGQDGVNELVGGARYIWKF